MEEEEEEGKINPRFLESVEFAWAYWEFGKSLDVRGCVSRQPERYRNEMILYSLENSENKFHTCMYLLKSVV